MSHPSGKIIVEIRGGRLTLYPVANSDVETTALLKELRQLILVGDFVEALERIA